MASETEVQAWTRIPIPRQASARQGLAESGSVKLPYWDTGGPGEVIVLNHPGAQGSACWAYQQPVLAAAGYRVIAWSRRGTDHTLRAPSGESATTSEDLLRLVDALGVEKCHLLGAAEGAAVAVHFALEHPERTRSLILAGGRLFVEEDDFGAMCTRTWLPDGHGAAVHFYDIGPSYRSANAEGVKAWVELGMAACPAVMEDTQRLSQPWGSAPLVWARLESLKAPVLLLTGYADHYSSPALNRLIAEHLQHCALALIDEAGGAAYWEQPDAFNETALDFLGRHAAVQAKPPPPNNPSTPPWYVPLSSRAPAPRIEGGPLKAWRTLPIPAQAPAREGYADTSPVKIWHWDTGGAGEAIVFCHPWSQSSACWTYQQPYFAKAGYRVIAWSARGFYKTERGPIDDPGTWAEDLHKLVEFLAVDKFHLVGCAAGGCAATSYAINHPERLHTLVLSGSIVLPDEPAFREVMSNLAAAPPGVKTNIPVEFREVGPSYRAGNPDGNAQWQALEKLAHPGAWYVSQPWGAVRNWQSLGQLTVPTLLQTGDADMSATPALYRLYSQHIPNCEMRVIREAGHAAYWEQPEVFNASVMEFIRRRGKHSETLGQ